MANDPNQKPPPLPVNPRDDPQQSKRFEDMARELGADEEAEAFERAIGIVVPRTASPPPAKTPAPKSKK